MYPDSLFKMPLLGNSVNLYGICIAVGLIACLLLYYMLTNHKGIDKDLQDFVFFTAIVAIAGGFLFAKLYQAIYDWIETGTFNFANAGITVMGGLIGGAAIFLGVYFGVGRLYFKGKKKGIEVKQFNHTLLAAFPCITIAHGFGRLGCLFAGCCHGTLVGGHNYTGSIFNKGGLWMKSPTLGWGYYIPTQLYEALFLFALTGVLIYLFYKRNNILSVIYLFSYGIWRFVIEFFRGDHVGELIPGLKPSQWQAFIFIALGIIILLIYHFKKIPFVLKKENEVVTETVEEKEKTWLDEKPKE